MKKIGSLFFFILISLGTQAHAAPCGLTLDSNLPAPLKSKLIRALEFLEKIEGVDSTRLHRKIFGGGVSGTTYCDFLQSRVRRITYGSCGFGTWEYACLLNGEMKVGDLFEIGDTLLRASVLLHEARHADNWPHANCPNPFNDANGNPILTSITKTPLAGQYMCDDSALGSYGTEVIWLKNIQRHCKNCSETLGAAFTLEKEVMIRIISPSAQSRIENDI